MNANSKPITRCWILPGCRAFLKFCRRTSAPAVEQLLQHNVKQSSACGRQRRTDMG